MGIAPASYAEEDKRYDIEIVVFKNIDELGQKDELWPAQLRAADLEGSVTLGTEDSLVTEVMPTIVNGFSGKPPEGFELLPPESYRLSQAAASLQRSSKYELLLHTAWRQPGLNRDRAVPVRINAGQAFRAYPPPAPITAEDSHGELGATADAPSSLTSHGGSPARREPINLLAEPAAVETQPPPEPVRVYPLDGTLTVTLGRFLHLYTNLLYSRVIEVEDLESQRRIADQNRPTKWPSIVSPGTESVPDLPIGQSYPFRYHRKMRSKELHYLDHPMLGMLVLMTPFEEDSTRAREVKVEEVELEDEPTEGSPESAPTDAPNESIEPPAPAN
jgi:hypothetical protein